MAQDSRVEVAKKLNNPIANMISVPFQLNYDQHIGPYFFVTFNIRQVKF